MRNNDRLQKHVYFWIGVFCTLLVALPVALAFSGAFESYVLQSAAIVFGVVTGLVLVLMGTLLFKDAIVHRIMGLPSGSIEDAIDGVLETVGHIRDGDVGNAKAQSKPLVAYVSQWYFWTQFYRWVVASAIGLLVVAGGFAGTVLLADQNKKIDEQTTRLDLQNELIAMELQRRIRDQFDQHSEVSNTNIIDQVRITASSKNGSCIIAPRRDAFASLKKPASRSTIRRVVEMANNDTIKDRVISALQNLLVDDDSHIVLSAVLALEQIDKELVASGLGQMFPRLELRHVHLRDIQVSGQGYDVLVSHSKIDKFDCHNCARLSFTNSLVSERSVLKGVSSSYKIGEEPDGAPIFQGRTVDSRSMSVEESTITLRDAR